MSGLWELHWVKEMARLWELHSVKAMVRWRELHWAWPKASRWDQP